MNASNTMAKLRNFKYETEKKLHGISKKTIMISVWLWSLWSIGRQIEKVKDLAKRGPTSLY